MRSGRPIGVKSVLAPGGALVLVDFHPLFNYLDDDWSLARKASGRAPVFYPEGVGDYVGMSGELLAVSGYIEVDAPPNPHGVWEYGWNLADIVTSVLEAGLQLTALREYPYTNGCLLLPGMQLKPDKRLYPPADLPQDLPLLFGLRATLAG